MTMSSHLAGDNDADLLRRYAPPSDGRSIAT